MNTSLEKAVHAIRQLCLPVVKQNHNRGLNSKYADLTDLMKELRPKLEERSLSVACIPGGVGMVGTCYVLNLTLEVTWTDDTEVEVKSYPCQWLCPSLIVSRSTGGSATNEAQTLGMASTYGTRYIIGRFFNVQFCDDDDAASLTAKPRTSCDGAGIKLPEGSKWSEWCHAFDVGTEPDLGKWTALADPSSETEEPLARPGEPEKDQHIRLNRIIVSYPDNVGAQAYFAEFLSRKALTFGIKSWGALRAAVWPAGPDAFADVPGADIINIVKALIAYRKR